MGTTFELMGSVTIKDHPAAWAILAQLENRLLSGGSSRVFQLALVDATRLEVCIDFAEQCGSTTIREVYRLLESLAPHLSEAARLTVRIGNDESALYLGMPDYTRNLRSRQALKRIMELSTELTPADITHAADWLLQLQGPAS